MRVDVALVATGRRCLVEPEEVGESIMVVPQAVIPTERVDEQRCEGVARRVVERGEGTDVRRGAKRIP